MSPATADSPLEWFLREGTRGPAREVVSMGASAVFPLLREVLRAERSITWASRGSRAADLLSFLPYHPRVTDVMWRLAWDLDREHIFKHAPRWYCGLAGPSVWLPLIHILESPEAHEADKMGAAEMMVAIWHRYPEQRRDIEEAMVNFYRQIDDEEIAAFIACLGMELDMPGVVEEVIKTRGTHFMGPDFAGRYRSGGAQEAPAGKPPSLIDFPIFEEIFPEHPELPLSFPPDQDTQVQEAVEFCAREQPDLLAVADAFATFRMQYPPRARVLKPSLVETFLLEYWPESVLIEEGKEKQSFEHTNHFMHILCSRLKAGTAAAKRYSRRIGECRIAFQRAKRDPRLFSRSKRIALAAREAGTDWRDRNAVVNWWYEKGLACERRNWPEWQFPSDWRLADVYLPSDVPLQEFAGSTTPC